MEQRKISRAVISRLPRYYRYLGDLLEAGVERISSNDLSKKMQVTASQIRQDLNNFGGFGQQGYGYNVKYLYTEIGKILGLDKDHNFIIIGAGNLGQALANYASFERNGFILKSLFDVNPRLEGVTIRGIPVRMLDELEGYLQENDIEIAALTLPKSKAEEVADVLVANGIKAIWNFAHTDLTLPKDVIVESVHLADSTMKFKIAEDCCGYGHSWTGPQQFVFKRKGTAHEIFTGRRTDEESRSVYDPADRCTFCGSYGEGSIKNC